MRTTRLLSDASGSTYALVYVSLSLTASAILLKRLPLPMIGSGGLGFPDMLGMVAARDDAPLLPAPAAFCRLGLDRREYDWDWRGLDDGDPTKGFFRGSSPVSILTASTMAMS